MRALSVLDLLAGGRAVRRTDVLTVAEIIATELAADHARGTVHGDIGPHTVLLELDDAGGVRDARLLPAAPSARPPGWYVAPEGGATGDVFGLGQVLRSLDASARAASDDLGLPGFVQAMIDPDPARRPTAADVLRVFDEGQIPPEPTAAPDAPAAASPARSWRLPVAAVAVFAVVLASGLWWIQRDREPAVHDAAPDSSASMVEAEATARPPVETPAAESAPAQTPAQDPVAGPTSRPEPGARAPAITGSGRDLPTDTVAQPPEAEGSTEFDQAWCRSHGRFVVRVQTNTFHATICRDGDTLNYHGLNLEDGLSIRTPATEHGTGWTAQGQQGITYEITGDLFEVRDGDVALASEEIVSRIDQSQEGDFRPWDLAAHEPISYPACDGAAIVVVDTFENLQGVNVQVRESLEASPGASYLNTDATCDSIERPSHSRGNRFLVYYWAGHDEAEVCALVEEVGTHALWLRDDVDPLEPVTCD